MVRVWAEVAECVGDVPAPGETQRFFYASRMKLTWLAISSDNSLLTTSSTLQGDCRLVYKLETKYI